MEELWNNCEEGAVGDLEEEKLIREKFTVLRVEPSFIYGKNSSLNSV